MSIAADGSRSDASTLRWQALIADGRRHELRAWPAETRGTVSPTRVALNEGADDVPSR